MLLKLQLHAAILHSIQHICSVHDLMHAIMPIVSGPAVSNLSQIYSQI